MWDIQEKHNYILKKTLDCSSWITQSMINDTWIVAGHHTGQVIGMVGMLNMTEIDCDVYIYYLQGVHNLHHNIVCTNLHVDIECLKRVI